MGRPRARRQTGALVWDAHDASTTDAHLLRCGESGTGTAFYSAALAAGGKDNGPPGVREIYHPNYYAAFVIGPDGHNIEAVCHLSGE